eukprot:5011512-Ditylum_brightwellii.AAC.1
MSTTERFNANLPSMHRAHFWHAAAAVGKTECYDTDTQRCKEINPMRTPRFGHAAVSLGNSIVVMGGHKLSSAEQYNTATEQWSAFPSMNGVRGGCAAAVLNGRIILVGGCDTNGNTLSSAEEYDPATGR